MPKLKRAKHGQKKIIAYIAIIMIAFNGEDVTLDVDDELKTLRSQVLSACGKMITVSKDGIMLNSKNIKICELIPEIKPSEEDGMVKRITVGINRLYQFINPSKNAAETNEKSRHYRSLKDQNGKYSIDLFLYSMDEIDSSDFLYYYISEFESTVKSNCSFDLEENEKEKYIDVSMGLANKLNEVAETGIFLDVLCDGSFYRDYDEIKSELDYATGIMFIRFRNYDLAYKHLDSVMEYQKATIKKENKIDEFNYVVVIVVLMINDAAWLAVPLLYSLIEYVRDLFKIIDETDERLYKLYHWLVLSAQSAKEEIRGDSIETTQSESDWLSLCKTAQDYDNLIAKYTNLMEQISGQEYHP